MPENKQPWCAEGRCRCTRTCIIQDKCLFAHPLAEGSHAILRSLLPYDEDVAENTRTTRVLSFFEKKQPAPVRPKSKKKKSYREVGFSRQQTVDMITIRPNADLPALKEYFKRIMDEPEPDFHEKKNN